MAATHWRLKVQLKDHIICACERGIVLKAATIVKKLRHEIQGLRLAVGRQRAEYEKSEQVL